jgi:galactose mutarotase-like enzyme
LSRIGGEWGELSVPARRRYPSRHAVPTRDAVAFKETFDVRQSFDACYTILQGPVVMRFPKQGFEWRLEFGRGFDHLYLYSPPSRRDILCIEPMTMAVDGFSRLARGKRGTGVRVLRPGESWGSSVSLEARVYSSTSSGSPV